MSAPALMETDRAANGVISSDIVVFHYFKKSAITRSLVLGTKETALCGFVGQTDSPLGPGTISSGSGSTMCPLCQMLMDEIKGN